MKRLLPVALLAIMLVGASTLPRNTEELLRRGNAAAEAGNWAEAARMYEMAEPWADEPEVVAFNLATARYHLAETGDLRELVGAEEGYRACLEGPRRGRALFGLGNCLMLRGVGPGRTDAVLLRAAIDRFTDALAEEDVDVEAVRHNRERARLLLLQAQQRAEGRKDDAEPGNEEKEDMEEPKEEPKKNGGTQEEGDGEGGKKKVAVKGDGTETPVEGEGKKGGGKGQLPPVPEPKDAPPISEGDALEHLEGAVERIEADGRAYRRSHARPLLPGKDW
jgi:hypothetical protein